ncbi:MAG: hypothetical protein K0R57_2754 [Paenibacillaceae bacterium]|jgi:Ni2+-binding GTPase involved in maturation of urease and hydrogenase|nr:hypothetical protein [Paenibacillaceae bacterium]
MKIITVSGPPSSGKTSVIGKAIAAMEGNRALVGVAKFDCSSAADKEQYADMGITARVELAQDVCPDHFYVSRLENLVQWGRSKQLQVLITESAGLCNRCSPHIRELPAVCVIDCLSGFHTPQKIGPMLALADVIVITKGDIVSQAEREVFASRTEEINPNAEIMFVNGITGQGAGELAGFMAAAGTHDSVAGKNLRYCMPSAVCSYCSGKTRIGAR